MDKFIYKFTYEYIYTSLQLTYIIMFIIIKIMITNHKCTKMYNYHKQTTYKYVIYLVSFYTNQYLCT